MKSFNTDIYLDGVTEEEIIATRDTKVKGYTFNPSLLCNTWLSNVVFPAPKNPLNTVTGNLLCIIFVFKNEGKNK